MNHLTFEQLNDLADRQPSGAEHRAHVAACAECRATVERILALTAAARDLPREISPPADVWSGLRSRVRDTRAGAWRWSTGWIAAAAAAILLVAGSLVIPGGNRAKGARPGLPGDPAPAAPAVLAVERNYASTLDELRETLDAQRSDLSPATVRVVERSLATIDSAIAEARQALAADPANQALVHVLAAQYRHKVELLKRATRLSST